MHPQLWTVPVLGLPIYSYGFMVMMGFLVGIFVASRRAKKDDLNPEIILDLGIIVMISAIIGARIAYVVIFHTQFSGFWQLLNVFDGDFNMFGIIIGWFTPYAFFMMRHKKLTFRNLVLLIVLSIISGAILGRIIYILFNLQNYDWLSAKDVFVVWKGGLVFYGGLILAIPAGLYYLKKKGLGIWKVGDIIAPSIALGLALGRIGCLLNGCCYGAVAGENNHLAISFPKIISPDSNLLLGSPAFTHHMSEGWLTRDAHYSLPVYPMQVYESVFALFLFVILSLILIKKPREGLVLGLFVFLYSIGRFVIEFWRGDKEPVFIGLTDSQIISVILLFASLVFLFYTRIKPQPASRTD